MKPNSTTLLEFANRVLLGTKHGPLGYAGPCNKDCVKCEAERIVRSTSFTPELGQLMQGNPWGAYDCPLWVDALVKEIIENIDRVYSNIHQRQWDYSDPGIPGLEFRSYYWGDDPQEQSKPNLKYGDVEVRWYKYPMKGSSLNVEAKPEIIIPWFESVLKAIKALESKE